MCIIIFNMGEGNSWMRSWFKLELWVTSLSDTPRLQYYDVQTLEYRYISKLPMKNERIWMDGWIEWLIDTSTEQYSSYIQDENKSMLLNFKQNIFLMRL